MKKTAAYLNSAALGLALSAAFTVSAIAAETAPSKPDADHILREACAKLAAAKQLSFKAHREIDPALVPGGQAAEDAHVKVTVMRPDKVMATAESEKGERRAYADGKKFTLLDAKMNLYSSVPMRTSIDGLVDQIDEKYGFTPPLCEFILSNPYKEFRRQATTVSFGAEENLHGGFLDMESVDCDRLELTGHGVTTELWIGANDHLMKKLVATFNDRPGKPQVRIAFSDWNLAAKVTPQAFTFVPPRGAMKIHMRTKAEMESAPAKAEAKKN
jgi:hypothetical protein